MPQGVPKTGKDRTQKAACGLLPANAAQQETHAITQPQIAAADTETVVQKDPKHRRQEQ